MTSKQSRYISRVLSPAVRLWLRSQVSQVENLQLSIEGSDRQILAGYIPHVSLYARSAVYQGLHLSQIQLAGENIRINLGQVLKGKPLHLMEPVPVVGMAMLQEDDLRASLHSSLLSNALSELLDTFVTRSEALLPTQTKDSIRKALENRQIDWETVAIHTDSLTLSGTYKDVDGESKSVALFTSLHLASDRQLRLDPLQIQMPPHLPLTNLDAFELNLGPEVTIEELKLVTGQIVCRACLKVIP